jgi:hypothetical protein
MIKTIKTISEYFGLTEEDIRLLVLEYINREPNIIFKWDEFYEFLIIENRDKKLEKILNRD